MTGIEVSYQQNNYPPRTEPYRAEKIQPADLIGKDQYDSGYTKDYKRPNDVDIGYGYDTRGHDRGYDDKGYDDRGYDKGYDRHPPRDMDHSDRDRGSDYRDNYSDRDSYDRNYDRYSDKDYYRDYDRDYRYDYDYDRRSYEDRRTFTLSTPPPDDKTYL